MNKGFETSKSRSRMEFVFLLTSSLVRSLLIMSEDFFTMGYEWRSAAVQLYTSERDFYNPVNIHIGNDTIIGE